MVDYYYDGVEFVHQTSWTEWNGAGGSHRIAALDLFAAGSPNGSSGVFFDDFKLVEDGDPCPGGCGFAAADMDCNGVIDALDIEPFICLLFDPNCVPCSTCAGDVNGDGTVNAEDIEPFINILFP